MMLRCGGMHLFMGTRGCSVWGLMCCHVMFCALTHTTSPSSSSLLSPSPEILEDCSIVLPRAHPAVHPPAASEESEPAMPDQPSSTRGQEPIAEGDCPTSEQDECEHVGQT